MMAEVDLLMEVDQTEKVWLQEEEVLTVEATVVDTDDVARVVLVLQTVVVVVEPTAELAVASPPADLDLGDETGD